MINGKKVLAIIPARGGSKGLPRKNILPLGDMPLIAWSIKAAKDSNYVDRVILSSDDDEISSVAASYGCDVPFKRPDLLADDKATSVDVVSHAIENCGDNYDIVILLQPTSPFRTSENIDSALEKFISSSAKSVVSVTESDKSPEWMYWLNESDSCLDPITPKLEQATRRQDTKAAYVLNGAIYIMDKKHFLETHAFVDLSTVAYVMDSKLSIDIDTKFDFEIAKLVLQNENL